MRVGVRVSAATSCEPTSRRSRQGYDRRLLNTHCSIYGVRPGSARASVLNAGGWDESLTNDAPHCPRDGNASSNGSSSSQRRNGRSVETTERALSHGIRPSSRPVLFDFNQDGISRADEGTTTVPRRAHLSDWAAGAKECREPAAKRQQARDVAECFDPVSEWPRIS